jgi:aspartate-semialdehyde dehydrogenase
MSKASIKPRPYGLRESLSDPALLCELAHINGQPVSREGGAKIAVTDPATGAVIGTIPALDAKEAMAAVDAAEAAFANWSGLLPQERSAILRRWYDLIMDAREDLAQIMTAEQGKPISESRGEIAYAASFVEFFAEEAKRPNIESVTSHLPDAEVEVWREPAGVAALITPWNFTSAMITRKAAAALAAGCTCLVHPSSETPFSATALAVLAARAGLPSGVFNIVTGSASTIVEQWTADARVRVLSFTGSTAVGKLLYRQSAETVKRLVMELGGHAPLIVFDDADLDKAVDIAVAAKFATSGQDCLAANRIYVQRGIYERFCAAFAGRVAALKVGNGLEEGVEIGPLMHARAVAKSEAHVEDALARGARCLAGGGRLAEDRLFFAPSLLVDVPDEADIMREETFGPVAAVTSFETEEEVVARANDTEYGLVAYVVTENGARQLRMGRALDYGMVAINRVKITGAPVPFGGFKQSGLGREGSRHGLEAFTELKYLCIDAG